MEIFVCGLGGGGVLILQYFIFNKPNVSDFFLLISWRFHYLINQKDFCSSTGSILLILRPIQCAVTPTQKEVINYF